MIPIIALDLSLDGIVVMSRAPSGPDLGKWWREGVVHLDDEDMTGAMQRMRATCAARAGEDFTSILVIPDSQLLFTSFARDDRDAETAIRSLLADRTPYPVEELVFDFVPRGDSLQVAVVARDTLQEAEAFVAGFGFRPVAIVGNPTGGTYPGIPNFGPTRLAADLLRGAPLTLALGDGFDVVPAPAMDDPPRPGSPADATGAASAGPRGAAGAAPRSGARRVEPGAMLPPGAPLEAPAGQSSGEPGLLPEDPSDFAAAMAATSGPVPIPVERSSDPAGRAPDLNVASGEADAEGGPGQAPATSPAFATRRRAPAAGAARTEPGLTRISPRLSPPDPDGTPRSMDAPHAMTTGTPAGPERRRTDPEEAREAAAPPPGRRASGRLGLYLTLSLLALLGILALWSVALRDDGAATRAAPGDVSSAVDLPAAGPPGDGEPGDVAARSAPVEDEAGPRTGTPVEDDLALLLPDSEGIAAPPETGTAAPPAPAPPVAAEDGTEDGAAEASAPAGTAPEIAVVTIDAKPFELPREIAAAPEAESADDIYVASIDPVISGSDAVALPRAVPPADTFSPQTLPAPAGTAFVTGNDGLAVASAAGTLAPGGYTVIAGRPATLPAPRPADLLAPQAAGSGTDDAARAELGRNRPVARPDDAPERAERLSFNGLTRAELTRTPPVRRPAAIAEAAARAEGAATRQAAAVQAAAAAAVASLAQAEAPAGLPGPDAGSGAALSPSGYALAQSFRPPERPGSVEQDAARIVTQRRPEAAAAAAATTGTGSASPPARVDSSPQTIRSAGGSVSRAATQSNQIRLREMNLIGVYGRANARRALVRLSNGRYVKIEVGDRLERGRVTAIGESEVIYQQNGRSYALRLPQS